MCKRERRKGDKQKAESAPWGGPEDMLRWSDAKIRWFRCYLVSKSCAILWDPMDGNLLGSSVHEISQARILEWVATQFSQFSSVAQSCPTLCDPMNRSTPGLPVHHQLPEFTQTHVHRVGDAIQPSHPLLSPFPPAPNPSQHPKWSYPRYSQDIIQSFTQQLCEKLWISQGI